MRCLICRLRLGTPGRLVEHGVVTHGANRATLERAVRESMGDRIVLVRSARGKLMVLIQPNLL